ncbi:5-oxoprolinase subunit PxpB [Paenibacillus ihbetae]|uniref:Kinase inhibitor n=1 Tax=Paenibacillus ihbetae TaxID=1870820 RepID=A0ABX3JYY4_9BACL|nr:5-oxoprolinase subunit PxpB [Paenibacillus ihbetae]OOC61997.1 kinase inhibitor [Paenibacillus ihbetae]
MSNSYSMHPLGDAAVLVQLGDGISDAVHQRVVDFTQRVERNPFRGFIECVPSFTTVSIYYDPLTVQKPDDSNSTFDVVCSLLQERFKADEEDGNPRSIQEVVDIPVCYGGDYGPDLEIVAEHNGITADEVIRLHSGQDYLVYAIGFAPGFPYIGGVPERIAAPRKPTPRPRIPAGSVGIAGTQTGIYPIETPGGWQIIGRTPLALFRPDRQPPTLLQGGQYIRFRPIDRAEYDRLREVKLCD